MLNQSVTSSGSNQHWLEESKEALNHNLQYIRVSKPCGEGNKQPDILRTSNLINLEAKAQALGAWIDKLWLYRQKFSAAQWDTIDFQEYFKLQVKVLSLGCRFDHLASQPWHFLTALIHMYSADFQKISADVTHRRQHTNTLWYCEALRETIAKHQRPLFANPQTYINGKLLDHSALAKERKEKARIEKFRQSFPGVGKDVEEGVQEIFWDRENNAFYRVVGKDLPLLRIETQKPKRAKPAFFKPAKESATIELKETCLQRHGTHKAG